MSQQLIFEKLPCMADPQESPNRQGLNETRRLFGFFAHQPWAILLDSGDCQHIDSRFDIIVANPIATIIDHHSHCEITQAGQQRISEQDPLVLIKDTLHQHLAIQHHTTPLPFIGGAVGYFGYDLGARYEKLPHQAMDDMQTPPMAVGIYQWALIKDNHQQCWYFVSQGPTIAQAAPGFMDFYRAKRSPSLTPFKLNSHWQANMDISSYSEKFAQIQAYLLNGDCYQINLAQRFKARYQGDEYLAYCQLAKQNQAPFSAFIRLPDFTVLSISPERLLQLTNGQIQTKPIKGTMPRHSDPQQDQRNAEQLYHSSKDRAENVMIVDLLRNDIGRVSKPGTVKVPSLFAIESFPAVHHMVSTIIGELAPQYHAIDLLRSAFPGGSITGAPKIRAMQIIDQLEPHRRSVYCGAIGYIGADGNMDTSITIRTLLCKPTATDRQIFCWAGGGIVADSQVASEYQETYDKINKILPVLTEL